MRGVNFRDHTNQEAHDTPWFGAQGSNTGPVLAILGGAPLWHSCYGGDMRKKCPYIYGLNYEDVKNVYKKNLVTVPSAAQVGQAAPG